MGSEHQPTNEFLDQPSTRSGVGSILTAVLVAILACTVGVWYQVGDRSMLARGDAISKQESQSGSFLVWLLDFTSSQGWNTDRPDLRPWQSDYVLDDMQEFDWKRDEVLRENAEMMEQIQIQVQEQSIQWAR